MAGGISIYTDIVKILVSLSFKCILILLYFRQVGIQNHMKIYKNNLIFVIVSIIPIFLCNNYLYI